MLTILSKHVFYPTTSLTSPPTEVTSINSYTQVFNESITSIGGGVVGSSNYEEVTIATYSGRVFGLTQEPIVPKPLSQELQAKLEALK